MQVHTMSVLNGFACGDYNCECTTCHKIFSGDKRAITCLECAGQEVFNAGMERAAEIAENDETDCINASDHYGCTQGSGIAESIRKEIERA